MAYSDFSFDSVRKKFGLTGRQVVLFPSPAPLPVPSWLTEILTRGLEMSLLSEKARSELLVMPTLVAARDLSNKRFSIFSGQHLDVDPENGLVGECDFVLALAPPLPAISAPIAPIVEAKKQDIEAGIGQCVAQLLGARQFNQAEGTTLPRLYGCVTSGETWQFLGLEDSTVLIDAHRYYIDNVGVILAAIQVITMPPRSEG